MKPDGILPSNEANGFSAEDAELARVLEKYLADRAAGQTSDPERFLADHPARADHLRVCLASLGALEKLTGR